MNNENTGIEVKPAILKNHLCLLSIRWQKNGKDRRWEAVKRIPKGKTINTKEFDDIAVVVPVTEDDKLVFISQFKATMAAVKAKENEEIDENDLRFHEISFPAGISDKDGLTIREIAELELAEEAKLGARRFEIINQGAISSGMSFEFETTYLARDLYPVLDKDGDEQSKIMAYRVPIRFALKWLQDMKAKGCEINSRVVPLVYQVKEMLRGEKSDIE